MRHTASMDTKAQRFARVAMVKNQGLTHGQINAIFESQQSSSHTESGDSGKADRKYHSILIEETLGELQKTIAGLQQLGQFKDLVVKHMLKGQPFVIFFTRKKDGKWEADLAPLEEGNEYEVRKIVRP